MSTEEQKIGPTSGPDAGAAETVRLLVARTREGVAFLLRDSWDRKARMLDE